MTVYWNRYCSAHLCSVHFGIVFETEVAVSAYSSFNVPQNVSANGLFLNRMLRWTVFIRHIIRCTFYIKEVT